MSDGLRLVSAIINTGSSNALLRTDREMLTTVEQPVFDFVRGFFRQYRELPNAQTVHQETGTRLPVANETLQFYIDQVADRHIYGTIRDNFAQLREQLKERDIESMRGSIDQMHRALQTRERDSRTAGLRTGIGLVLDRLNETVGMGGITGIETPWPTYNEITGGYQNSDLITIVGRPGTAKTYNMLVQAKAARDAGHSVVVVTTEMGIEQLSRRIVSLELGIQPDLLKKNMISTYARRRIEALHAEIAEDENFKIVSIGMSAQLSTVEALLQELGPSICFLDGTYLLRPSVKGKMNRIERVGEVFDELKGLTLDANIPIVNTMQFNRQAGKDGKEGSLETIGFTDAVGMHSSIVIGLKHGPTENPRLSRTMQFLKGREGESGEVHTNFKFAPVDMSELVIEEEEGTGETGAGEDVDWMLG